MGIELELIICLLVIEKYHRYEKKYIASDDDTTQQTDMLPKQRKQLHNHLFLEHFMTLRLAYLGRWRKVDF